MHNHGFSSIINFLQLIANGFIETLNQNLSAINHTNLFYDKYKNLINYLEKAYRQEETSLGNVKYLSIEINSYNDFLKTFQIELNKKLNHFQSGVMEVKYIEDSYKEMKDY